MTFAEWAAIWVVCGGLFWCIMERVDPCVRALFEEYGFAAATFTVVCLGLVWPISTVLCIRELRDNKKRRRK